MVRSEYSVGIAQTGGRCYVTFMYTLDSGEEVRTERGPLDPKTDLDALLAQIGAEIEAEVAGQSAFAADRAAAEAKLAAVLDEAVKGGKISTEELKAAGVSVDLAVAQAADVALVAP